MKVVIVDKKGRYAAALTENGEVRRIYNNHYSIGDEIELYDLNELKRPHMIPRVIKRTVAVAAAVVVLAVGGIATAYAIPYGTVSVEGDTSIEYTINCFNYVLDVNALDEGGEAVLNEIDMSELKHHNINDAVAVTVEQMDKDGYLAEDKQAVTVTADTGDNSRTESLQKELDNIVRDRETPQNTPENAAEETPADVNGSTENNRQEQAQAQPEDNGRQDNSPQADGVANDADSRSAQQPDNSPARNQVIGSAFEAACDNIR